MNLAWDAPACLNSCLQWLGLFQESSTWNMWHGQDTPKVGSTPLTPVYRVKLSSLVALLVFNWEEVSILSPRHVGCIIYGSHEQGRLPGSSESLEDGY